MKFVCLVNKYKSEPAAMLHSINKVFDDTYLSAIIELTKGEKKTAIEPVDNTIPI